MIYWVEGRWIGNWKFSDRDSFFFLPFLPHRKAASLYIISPMRTQAVWVSFVGTSHLLGFFPLCKVGSAAMVSTDWISVERGGGKTWLWEGIYVQSCQNGAGILLWEGKLRFEMVQISHNMEGTSKHNRWLKCKVKVLLLLYLDKRELLLVLVLLISDVNREVMGGCLVQLSS